MKTVKVLRVTEEYVTFEVPDEATNEEIKSAGAEQVEGWIFGTCEYEILSGGVYRDRAGAQDYQSNDVETLTAEEVEASPATRNAKSIKTQPFSAKTAAALLAAARAHDVHSITAQESPVIPLPLPPGTEVRLVALSEEDQLYGENPMPLGCDGVVVDDEQSFPNWIVVDWQVLHGCTVRWGVPITCVEVTAPTR